MLDHDLEPEDRSVRGSLVLGLSKVDISSLDAFEGDVGTSLLKLKHLFTDHSSEISNTLGRKFKSIPWGPSSPSRPTRSRNTESQVPPGKTTWT